MVARISLGCKRVVVPVYAVSGVVMIVDQMTPGGKLGLVGIFVCIGGGIIQVVGKLEQIRVCMLEKIDRSVGRVWDAGKRAGERRRDLEAASKPLAAVRDLVPRR